MNPIVIIGSGMAGYTLAREFRKLDSTAPVVMISADDAVNYAKPTLSNALVILDLLVIPADLYTYRLGTTALAMVLLLIGLIWESQ